MARRDVKFARKSQLATSGGIDHTLLANIGTNTHAQIDTHIADGTLHFTESSIDHANIQNVGTNTHAQIDTHIADATLHFTEASIDHGSISGLADDDHTQYHNDTRGDARYYTQTQIDNHITIDGGLDTSLYYSGNVAFKTRDNGIEAYPTSTSNGHLYVYDNLSEFGVVKKDTAGVFKLYNVEIDGHVQLTGRQTSGTEKVLLDVDPNGSTDIYYGDTNSTPVFGTQSYGIRLQRSNGTGTPVLELYGATTGNSSVNYTQGATTRAQIQYDNATELFFRTTTTGDGFRFYNDVDGTMATFNSGGSIQMYHAGVQAFSTLINGIKVFPSSNANDSNVQLQLATAAGTQKGLAGYNGSDVMRFRNQVHGGAVYLEGEDAGGTLRSLLQADPDGAATLYNVGDAKIVTNANGTAVRGSLAGGAAGGTNNTRIVLEDSAGVDLGILGSITSTHLHIRSLNHGGQIRLEGENNSGTVKAILYGDPDGGTGIYYAGDEVIETTSRGVNINTGSSGLTGRINVYDNTNTQKLLIEALATGSRMYSWAHGEPLYWQLEDAAGAAKTMIYADPDAALWGYYAGNIAFRTTAYGLDAESNTTNDSRISLIDSTGTYIGLWQGTSNSMRIKTSRASDLLKLVGTTSLSAEKDLFTGDPDIGVGFFGAAAVAPPTYTVTNDATDRTYDANSTTLDELADVVGTIIADLQANGLFQ